ncbi:MAG: hypothetical protein EU532_03375 [Promethearchaeota archaeon]|nr:MAG: hypothetical protein EU532_03375 [Candidatus Lokiarchaeota archaeon]
MTLQYYDLLQDKTEKRLQYLASYIAPELTIGELQNFIDDIANKPKDSKKTNKSNKLDAFKEIGDDFETHADFSKLTEQQLKNIYQVFISREINDRFAVKWRFYQYFKYIRDIIIESIKINQSDDATKIIDFIIETEDNKYIFVLCFDVLDIQKFNQGIEGCNEFVKANKIKPDRIFFVTNKTFRDIPIENAVIIDNEELIAELWLEINDESSPFNNEDMLIISNSDLKIAGFNFTSMEDLLDYVYEFSDGGQISILKKADFFSEVEREEFEEELIWKGIMIKNDIS